MQKTLITIVSAAFLGLAGIASAATISLSPTTVSVNKGQTVTMTISVDAASSKIYTVKAALSYPVDLLTPASFAFAEGTPMWISLSQTGYDSMSGGSVIKTAGFPGGFSGAKVFGTLTFTAKANGTATVAVSSASLAYDAQSKNALTGTQGTSVVTVAAPVPVPKPAPAPTAQTQTQPRTTTPTSPAEEPTEEGVALGEQAPIVQEPTTTLQPIAPQSMLAAVGGIVTLGTNSVIVGLLVAVIVLVLAGYAIYAVIQRARRLM